MKEGCRGGEGRKGGKRGEGGRERWGESAYKSLAKKIAESLSVQNLFERNIARNSIWSRV